MFNNGYAAATVCDYDLLNDAVNVCKSNPDIKKEKAPVVKIAAGVLDYLNILRDEDLRNSLNDRVKRLRKLQNETGGTNAEES